MDGGGSERPKRSTTTAKALKQDISGIKDIIEDALRPLKAEIAALSKQDTINLMLENFASKIEKKFTALVDENQHHDRIKDLEERLDILESKSVIVKRLDKKINQSEQYSKRVSLRNANVALPDADDKENFMEKVSEVLAEIGCGVEINAVDRAHRIGRTSVNDQGVPSQQMIVKFRSFSERTIVYKNRKKANVAKIQLDLTKRNLDILSASREAIKDNQNIEFLFTDINCNLAVKKSNGDLRQ